ncbi:MAG: PD-(D/E)XK nuclease family protein [archaeon]
MACYSHSKLSTFEACKQKYKFSYIDGIRFEKAKAAQLVLGGVVHKVLEKLYSDLKFNKVNSLKEILNYFETVWGKEWTEEVINPKEAEGITEEHFKSMGKKYIEEYYNHYSPFNQMRVLGIETEDKLKLKNGASYDIRIDKLGCNGETYFVCDYKTDLKLKDQDTADQDRQLAMYSLWVKKKFKDAKKIVLLWHMLAFDKEVTSERTAEHLEKLEENIVNLIKEIESTKEYPTSVSGRCVYCEYKQMCPSFKHEAELEIKTVKEFKADEGVKLVNKYSKLKDIEKETKKEVEEIQTNLIAFSQQHEVDIIYGSNKKVSVKEYDRIMWSDENKEKLEELLKKKGLYETFSMISYPKLNAQINEGNLSKTIEKLSTKEKDYRINLANKKKDE